MTRRGQHAGASRLARSPIPAVEQPWAGTAILTRFALRRDRLRLAVWTLAIGLVTAAGVASVITTYPDEASRQARAAISLSPATVLMAGPMFGMDEASLGALVANELVLFLLVIVAVMSILLVVRHTRSDEEAGRTELLRALPTGPRAPAAAAIAAVLAANLLVALAAIAGLVANGLEVTGSVAIGAASLVTGLLFGAVAAVTAQVTSHARGASGMAMAVLGSAFLIRAVGDVMEPATGSWLSWASPLAWAHQVRAYADLRWWPLLLCAALAAGLFALAGALSTRRDLGAGLRREPPGPAAAGARLLSARGLARRLLRASFVSWTAGIVICAVVMGALAYAVEDMIADAPQLTEWIGGGSGELVNAFVAFLLNLVAVGVTAFGVSAVLRLRAEEQAGRAEVMIATGSSRMGWLGGWLVVALGQAVAALMLGGLGAGLGVAAATGEARWIGELVAGAAVYLPAVVAVLALAIAVLGVTPRWAALAWAAVGWIALVALLGEILGLPEVARNLSPVHLTPMVPLEQAAAGPLLALIAAAIGLAIAGAIGFRRRDVTGN